MCWRGVFALRLSALFEAGAGLIQCCNIYWVLVFSISALKVFDFQGVTMADKKLVNGGQGYGHVAVCVPCYNEALTIAGVIEGFRSHLPGVLVYVFDNNSTDGTSQVALACGAQVFVAHHQGKGNVVRRAFADVEADVYILVDGDGTYDPAAAPLMVERLLTERLDMVVGCRQENIVDQGEKYRSGHRFGNLMLTSVLSALFGGKFSDILSGYRVFSRRYVKSFPALSSGFETETELTVHALELRMPCGEVMTLYGSRPAGSQSKLSTYKDGFKILVTMLRLYMVERPLMFFSLSAGLGDVGYWFVCAGFDGVHEYRFGASFPYGDTLDRTGLVCLAGAGVWRYSGQCNPRSP